MTIPANFYNVYVCRNTIIILFPFLKLPEMYSTGFLHSRWNNNIVASKKISIKYVKYIINKVRYPQALGCANSNINIKCKWLTYCLMEALVKIQ